MNTSIADILAKLVEVEETLTITKAAGAPADLAILKAYPWPLDWNELPNWQVPAVFNTYSLVGLDYGVGLLERLWTITVQTVVADARREVAAELVSHFLESLLVAMVSNTTIKSTVNTATIRGGTPTLGSVSLGGVEYVATTILVDARTKAAVDFA